MAGKGLADAAPQGGSPRAASPGPPYPLSDHFDGKRFFNPGVDTDKGLGDLWRWHRTAARAAWPKRVQDESMPSPPDAAAPGEIALTLVGQATVLVQVEGLNILTDPMFSRRASPFRFIGPRRVRPPGIALDDLPRVHLVLLSHNHYDHLDLPSLRWLRDRWAPRVVTGLGNEVFLARRGIGGAVALDWWDGIDAAPGARVTFVPAQHWSSRTMFDRRRTLWGGFVVGTRAGTVYFAGDTGYMPLFGEIAGRFRPDIALLPIGAYEPRWFMGLQHMNPDEAVRAHRDLGATLSLGLHWGTFQLTDEAIDAPVLALDRAKTEQSVDPGSFVAPAFGRTIRWRRDTGGS